MPGPAAELRSPKAPSKPPAPGLGTHVIGEMTPRGCGKGCAGQMMLWGLRPGVGNALRYLPLHITSPVWAPWRGGARGCSQTSWALLSQATSRS